MEGDGVAFDVNIGDLLDDRQVLLVDVDERQRGIAVAQRVTIVVANANGELKGLRCRLDVLGVGVEAWKMGRSISLMLGQEPRTTKF